jgi:hypothetical protein
MTRHPDAIEPPVLDQEHFRHLRWSLQGLAEAGSDQRQLFAEQAAAPGHLAADFDHWAAVIGTNYDDELSPPQRDALAAIGRKLATISRDGAEFDVELWTEAALRTSEHWADIRRLAADGLAAFGWLDADASQPHED